jgi:hypothetical protein
MRSLRSLAIVSVVILVTANQPGAAARDAAGPAGQNDGIKVHGHWVIEVRNPDGALAARHDFHNAFHTGEGRNLLAQVLGKVRNVMEWRVLLGESGESGPCGLGACIIDESRSGLNVNASGGELTLTGDAVASADGSFNRVATQALLTPIGVTHTFTEKFLAAPITLVAGQSVHVKVTISFS